MRPRVRVKWLKIHLIFFFSFFSQPGPIPLTIENVLFNALVKVGAVSQDNADNPTKVGVFISNIQSLY